MFFKTEDSTTFWSVDLQIKKNKIKQSTSTRSQLNLTSTGKIEQIYNFEINVTMLIRNDPNYISMIPLGTIYEVSLALLQI